MPPRSYKTKQKISASMQGTSNFAGKEHSIGSKARISAGRGKEIQLVKRNGLCMEILVRLIERLRIQVVFINEVGL